MPKKISKSSTKRYSKQRKLFSSYAKRLKKSPTMTQSINSVPFPSYKLMKLAYWDNIVGTQTTGSGMTQQWRLNSAYDFDYTYTGHQPYYYDQITALYGTYRVYKVVIDYAYTCDNGSGVPLDSQIVFRPTPDGTTPTPTAAGFIVESERPLSHNNYFGAGAHPAKGRLTYYPHIILGMSKSEYNDDDKTSAAVTTNPSTVPYLNFMALSTAANSYHVLRVKVQMYVKFFNRKIVSGS